MTAWERFKKIITVRRVAVTALVVVLAGALLYLYRPIVKTEQATEPISYPTETE